MPDNAQIARWCCAIAGTAAVPLLWWMGLAGGGKYDEHVVEWRIVVSGLDGDGLRVHDGITVDFGNERRSGMDRVIDNGFGAPEKVYGRPWVIAPDQPAPGPGVEFMLNPTEQSLDVTEATTVAHLRTERARSTGVEYVSGHYDLPVAPSIGEQFEYELIPGGRAVDTDDVYVYLNAMALESAFCRRGSGVDCELQTADGYYAIELSSLPAGDSLTIGGTVTGWTDWVDLPEPEVVERRVEPSGERWLLWFLSAAFAGAGFELARGVWRRRSGARWRAAGLRQVLDGEPVRGLVPLPSLSPWKAAALLHHQIGVESAGAWFAEQVAVGVLTVEKTKGASVFHRGPNLDLADLGMRDEVASMFRRSDEVRLEPFLRPMERVVRSVRDRQAVALREHRWWRRFAPRGGGWFSAEMAVVFAVWAVVLGALIATNWSYSWPVAIALLLVVPASTNAAIAWWMAPQLGLEGEDIVAELAPLQQLLQRADTSHVEAAHQAGLLPQYSAWAVALGAANRWREAILAADLPDDAAAAALGPLEMGRNGGPWSLAADFPSNELRPPLRPEPADA